jgi:hypothetical protein
MSRKQPAAKFGTAEGFSYAVRLDGTDNDFLKLPFGRQLDGHRAAKQFQETAQTAYVGCKGRSSLAAVRAWVRENKPAQFFARWKADSPTWKDDSVEISYMR